MMSSTWLIVGYSVIWLGFGVYLAFLGCNQKKIIQKLELLEGTKNEQ